MPPSFHPSARRSRGLTLVELLLAVGLVAVLASLATSSWNGWRDKVRTQTAQADITAMAAAIDAYFYDTGNLPESLAAVGHGGRKDPWGRTYVYRALNTPASIGMARKDHSLVPLNTDYDLYSKGPDGSSASPLTAKSSKDDILRANNGRFVGPASLY